MSRRVLVAVAAVLVVGVAGCGSSGTGSSGGSAAAAQSSAAVCSAAVDLRTSMTALQQVDLVKQGTQAVQQAFGQVKTDIGSLADAARSQLKPQVAKVQADRDAVQAGVDAAKAAPNAQTLGALRTAVQTLGQDVQSLISSVGSTC
jgi:ABC-type glycerol-3-phosphate transport system substrate-binding protein